MEFRCSPYHPLLLLGILGILICSNPSIATAQCKSDFSYKAFSAEVTPTSGRIEITTRNPEPGVYTFKVFRIEGDITLVQTGEDSSPEKIVIEGLTAGNYLVKIEWGTNCYKTMGGLDGILVTRKEQAR